MKILCVSPSYYPAFQYGGPIYSVHGLNKALVKKGVDVTVYTTNVGLGGKVPINKEVDVDGVKVTYFEFTKVFEFLGATGWQFSLQMTRALKKNLRAFDLINIEGVWSYLTATVAYYCRQYRKTYLITPHGVLYPYTFKKKSWKKWPYYHFVAKRDLKGASAIRYTTRDEAEQCHSRLALKNRVIVIHNGIEMSEFNDLPAKESLTERYPILKGKKVILFLGRIHWIKGMDILLKAYSILANERDDIHLLIVGNDEERYDKKVKRWIREYGMKYVDYGLRDNPDEVVKGTLHPDTVILPYTSEVSDALHWVNRAGKAGGLGEKDTNDVQVTFTGMLTGKEKLEVIAGSEIFVLPSYSENFGIAVVETMACGVPVVISNKVGIHKEVEKNKAGIVVDTNAESLHKGIKLLLENPELKKEIATNGRNLVEEYYDIDRVADRIIKVYEEVLNNAKQ